MARNYRREYDTYHSKPKQKKRRAARNKSIADAVKKGTAKKGIRAYKYKKGKIKEVQIKCHYH